MFFGAIGASNFSFPASCAAKVLADASLYNNNIFFTGYC
jgi:hypothetical protein